MSKYVTPELAISTVALVISLIATATAIYFARASLRTNVLPVLVFVYADSTGWAIKNVGSGPALNIVVADQTPPATEWERPTRLYPLAEGQRVLLPWVGQNPDKLAVVYQDVHNRDYTSVVDQDLTIIHRDRVLPEWPDDAIARVWER